MSRGSYRPKTPTRHGIEAGARISPSYEAGRIAHMVRIGLLTVDGARALILVNEAEAAVLRKILQPSTADAVLLFRRNVLRLFDALVEPDKTRRAVSATRRR